MNKQELKKFLDSPSTDASAAIVRLKEFVLEPTNKAIIVNYMVDELKKRTVKNNGALFNLFFTATRQLVTKTRLCKSSYAEQTLLRNVWEATQLQMLVVTLANKGFQHLGMPEKKQEKLEEIPKKPKDHKETPEERKARLKKQAELMREAKARKKAEEEKMAKRKAEEAEILKKHRETNPKKTSTPSTTSTQSTKKSDKESKFSKEELEQLELLRNMRV